VQNDRAAARLSAPGFIVATRKIAARVSGADTGCATTTASVCEVASAMKSLARAVMSGRRMRIKNYLSMTFGGRFFQAPDGFCGPRRVSRRREIA
jgi:hypothetical protein